ncbi:MAG: hypothetical protein QOF59_3147 [Actinomycetota bacterium]|nr:hypothetical protein [Actinomycetota bacterium]
MQRSSDITYDTPGVLTEIGDELLERFVLPSDVVGICRIAQSLVIPPDLARAVGIPEERNDEKSIRPANALVARLTELDPTPLHEPRPPQHRVVGTCRDFTVLSCAFLRHRGIPARARCGFARYFEPTEFVDHWVVEYWTPSQARWVRIDSEILGLPFVSTPDDLEPDEFLSGGEAWTLCRETDVDPMRFGVVGAPHAWGIAEIRGNAIRDLAALNKVEMLPWDEWGRMEPSYKGETGADFDALIDTIAATCASNDPSAIRDLYASEDLTVPPTLIV